MENDQRQAGHTKHRNLYLSVLFILLIGAFYRIPGLARDQRFHPDEAFYADLSRRVGIWGDWQLHDVTFDKPPFFFFTGGFFHRILGVSEFSTRLPNAFASLIALALVFTLTHHLTKNLRTAVLAALLVALSPLDIALAISGFIDSPLVMWLLLS
ncbi:MAG TPA: glycosyltransferase family 39 protein, partial [Aggregatilineales bacterium]|nr:glycosyltransferase family 39 protein [Aggregatilineales bacterium]